MKVCGLPARGSYRSAKAFSVPGEHYDGLHAVSSTLIGLWIVREQVPTGGGTWSRLAAAGQPGVTTLSSDHLVENLAMICNPENPNPLLFRTTMKVILLGNAGAGKSTLSQKLTAKQAAARLSLDEVAFQNGAERRPLEDSVAEVKRFIEHHQSWIIEGCYSDIIEAILEDCEELVFLNPGVDACVAHCRARPWEPEKFSSSQEQDDNLENLIEWVRSYETRPDEYGLLRHRAIYDAFAGKKREFNDPSQYESA